MGGNRSKSFHWPYTSMFLFAQVPLPALLRRRPSPAGGLGLQHGGPPAARRPQGLPAGRSDAGQDGVGMSQSNSVGHRRSCIKTPTQTQVQSLFGSTWWTLQSFSVRGCCITLWLYILFWPGLNSCWRFFFLWTIKKNNNNKYKKKHDFREKSTFFFPSFLCEETSITCRPKCMGGRLNYGPYCLR